MKIGLIISSLVLLLVACGNRSHQSGKQTTAPYLPERIGDSFNYVGRLMYAMRDEDGSFDTLVKDVAQVTRIGNDSFRFYFFSILYKPFHSLEGEEVPRLLIKRGEMSYRIKMGATYDINDSSDEHSFNFSLSMPSIDSIVYKERIFISYFSRYDALEFRGKRIK